MSDIVTASDRRRKTHSSCPLGKHHPVPFPFNGTERLLFIWRTEGETEIAACFSQLKHLVFSPLPSINIKPPLTKYQQWLCASSRHKRVWCETQCWHCSPTWSRRCCTRRPAPPMAPLESTWEKGAGRKSSWLGGQHKECGFAEDYRAERRDEPAVAVGEGKDVMLIVLQTGHATCSGSESLANWHSGLCSGSRRWGRGLPWPMLWTPMDMPRNLDLVQMWALNWIFLFKHSA